MHLASNGCNHVLGKEALVIRAFRTRILEEVEGRILAEIRGRIIVGADIV
jgi:hypothetical protein